MAQNREKWHRGIARLFRSESFHINSLRIMASSAAMGAAPGEVLSVIGNIQDQSVDSWFESWAGMARTREESAEKIKDGISRGKAFLRASNYYRASQLYVNPMADLYGQIYNKSVDAFRRGIKCLGIKHEILEIPYENAKMSAYYFPGDNDKPLILIFSNYYGTSEESFFLVGASAVERRYPVALIEGPGQIDMIRKYNLKLTPAWEKPVGAALDFFEKKIDANGRILFGAGISAILASRAAAFEKRIDGVIAFAGPFDMRDSAYDTLPRVVRWAHRSGYKRIFNSIALLKAKRNVGVQRALVTGLWSLGEETPYDLINRFRQYSLKEVADKVTCRFLLLSGKEDHQHSLKQVNEYKEHLTNAESFTHYILRNFNTPITHGQLWAFEQIHELLFDWVKNVFQGRNR